MHKMYLSYYKGRSVPDSVCLLTPPPFTDRRMQNLAGRLGLGMENTSRYPFLWQPLYCHGNTEKLVFGAGWSGLIDPELGIQGCKTLTTVAMVIYYHSNNKIIMYLWKSIFMPGPLQSVCAGESQAGNPIGSALVFLISQNIACIAQLACLCLFQWIWFSTLIICCIISF